MKTTLELPDSLMMRIKMKAVQEDKKLKDAIMELLLVGLRMTDSNSPKRDLPVPVNLGAVPLTTEEVQAAIQFGRE